MIHTLMLRKPSETLSTFNVYIHAYPYISKYCFSMKPSISILLVHFLKPLKVFILVECVLGMTHKHSQDPEQNGNFLTFQRSGDPSTSLALM